MLKRSENGGTVPRTFGTLLRERFRENRAAVWSVRVLYFLIFVAVFADILANDKPLYAHLDGESSFPVFKEIGMEWGLRASDGAFLNANWHNKEYEAVIWPLVPYSSTGIDFKNGNYRSPFDTQKVSSWRFRHFLGTDQVGRDTAAGMIHGTRSALLVGLIAMSVATIFGIFFGVLSGWYGDKGFKVSRIRLIMNVLAIVPAWFYGFSVRAFTLREAESSGVELLWSALIVIGIFVLFNTASLLLERLPALRKKVTVPLDLLIMRLIEVINSVPVLLLLLASVAVLSRQSVLTTMVIIGLIAWTGIARFLRAELLKVKKANYIEAARAIGLSDRQIIWRHALPNALTPVLITVAFGIAGAVLLESTLSFLGIGAGADEMTWGGILRNARDRFGAWWLAVFPGTAIFATVTVFNLIGEGLTDAPEGRKGGI